MCAVCILNARCIDADVRSFINKYLIHMGMLTTYTLLPKYTSPSWHVKGWGHQSIDFTTQRTYLSDRASCP